MLMLHHKISGKNIQLDNVEKFNEVTIEEVQTERFSSVKNRLQSVI